MCVSQIKNECIPKYFCFFLQSGEEEEKNKLWMDTDEHTASTILVIQIVTKIKERTLSIPYWSFGCLQTTWITVGAVFIFIFFPTQNRWGLQVRFCHMDIEWCYFFFCICF